MKIAMVLTVLFSVFLMSDAMAWDGVPAWEKPLPRVEPLHQGPSGWEQVKQFKEEMQREADRARERERHWGEIDYRNRHNHIYITGCHHYSESCRMQLRD